MRFLVDECLSINLAQKLADAGHEAVHIIDCGLAGHADTEVLDLCVQSARVLLSADTDFGEILARTRSLRGHHRGAAADQALADRSLMPMRRRP